MTTHAKERPENCLGGKHREMPEDGDPVATRSPLAGSAGRVAGARRSTSPYRQRVLVLCSHLPGEGHFRSERFEVVGIECRDDFDYWRGLAEQWDSDATIVNAEHDLEITDGHVQALLDCPEECCSWAYTCHWASTHLTHDVIAAGTGERDATRQPAADYLQGGEEWAAWSAIGLVKLTAAARTGPLRQEPWSALELAVHDAVSRPWHMHGNAPEWPTDLPPVVHHHW